MIFKDQNKVKNITSQNEKNELNDSYLKNPFLLEAHQAELVIK